MAKFVPDLKTKRWVIIASGRVSRPHDNTIVPESEKSQEHQHVESQVIAPIVTPEMLKKCPFEPGNEVMNPTELFRVGGANGDPNWRIRVITNKYPITDLHEVIIHSPDHLKDIDELPEEHIELLFQTYRQRYNFHMHEGNGQVIIFNNHDAHAGASLRHPHSQIVVVPGQINLDTVPREPVSNLVIDNKFFYLYCPDFSQWPYELWIAPKKLGTVFGEITDEEIKDLVPLLKKSLQFIIKKFREMGAMRKGGDDLDEVPYNYYLYHGTDWYLRIIPRLIHRAGFELGTGLSVNIVDPAIAAEEYRAGLAG